MTADAAAPDAAAAVAAVPGPVPAEQAVARIESLRTAIEAARGRLDAEQLAVANAISERVRGRLRLSPAHTVVALAGATGSGKSSLFNALTGLDLAAVGVRRPTTSWATACAWDPTGATDLLDWLGIPDRHRVARLSTLDVSRDDMELDGLVLLDLPDHDSTEVSHRLEVDRLVVGADLIVWVLDPQKYADAALHEHYLRPHATHADVMLVVLNQVDRLSTSEGAEALADVHRLLAADGLGDVPVLATSTVGGDGLPELRQVLIDRLEAKQSVRARVAVDVTNAARQLAATGGVEPMAGSDDLVRAEARQQLVGEVAGAAGLDRAGTNARLAARRARQAAGWPPGAQFRTGASTAGAVGPVTVDENLVDGCVDDYVEQVGAGAASAWLDAMRAGVTAGRTGLTEQLVGVSLAAASATSPPMWARLLGWLQPLLVLVAGCSLGWQLVGTPPDVAGWPAGWFAAVIVGAAAVLLSFVGGTMAGRAARRRVERDAGTARAAIAEAVDQWVVGPVDAELAAHAAWRRALTEAGAG